MILEFLENYVLNGGTTFEPINDMSTGKMRSPSQYSEFILRRMQVDKANGNTYWTDERINSYTKEYYDNAAGEEKRKLYLQCDWSGVLSFKVLLPVLNLLTEKDDLTPNDMRGICLYVNNGQPSRFSCILRLSLIHI